MDPWHALFLVLIGLGAGFVQRVSGFGLGIFATLFFAALFAIPLYSAIDIVGCLIGDFLGKIVFGKLDSNKLKLVIYVGMLLSGIIMIF